MASRTRNGQGQLPDTALSLDVHLRSQVENPVIRGSLKLAGAMPVKQDLNDGEQVTVTVNGPDGEVLSSGVFEIGLPTARHIRQKGVGIIGAERVHTATFDPDG